MWWRTTAWARSWARSASRPSWWPGERPKFPVTDKAAVERLTAEMHEDAKTKGSKRIYELGHRRRVLRRRAGRMASDQELYDRRFFPEHEKLDGKYLRTHFKMKHNPCWACQLRHCKTLRSHRRPVQGLQGRGAGIRRSGCLGAGDREYRTRGLPSC